MGQAWHGLMLPLLGPEAWAWLVGHEMEVAKSHRFPLDLLQNNEMATSMTEHWRHKVLTHYRGQQAFGQWSAARAHKVFMMSVMFSGLTTCLLRVRLTKGWYWASCCTKPKAWRYGAHL